MASSKTTILLRCPFCGSDKVLIDQFGDEVFAVSCEDDACNSIGPEGRSREHAAAKWNQCNGR